MGKKKSNNSGGMNIAAFMKKDFSAKKSLGKLK